MESVLKQTKVKSFEFLDDDFLGVTTKDRERCTTFAKVMIKQGLDFSFGITTQSKGFNEDLLRLLKDAGLERVFIGIESWADSQLKRYAKFSTRRDNLRAIEMLDKLSIPFGLFLIPLDPYVTRGELKATLRETERIGLDSIEDMIFCKRLILDEYCQMFEQCKKDGLVMNYNPLSYSIPYRQKNQDVIEIVRAAEEIRKRFDKIMNRFEATGKEKELSETWYVFFNDVRLALKRKLFRDFKDFVKNVDSPEDGKGFIASRMADTEKRISSICATVSRDKLERFNGLSVFIDGEEISTRLKEVFKFPVKNNFWVI
jgi:DNA repair photolyase